MVTRREQRGFALLIVFLLAAAIAFALYQQIPRVAFESERDKEELLLERGHEYQRAIQLYFAAYQKYPSKIEDLENTNNKRYLRRRYIDPFTGKNEWRLIHVNGAGQLTDSLVKKPPATGTAGGSSTQTLGGGQTGSGTLGGGIPGAAGTAGTTNSNTASNGGFNALSPASTTPDPNAQPQAPNAAVVRRPSDRTPGSASATPAVDPNDPRTWPPIALYPATGNQPNGQPGQQPGFNPNGAQAGGIFNQQQMQSQQAQGVINQQIQNQGFPNQNQFQAQPFQVQSQQGQQFNTAQAGQSQGFTQQFPGQQFPGQQFPGQQFPGQQAVPGSTVLNPQGNPVTVGPDGQLIPLNNPNAFPGQTNSFPGQTNTSFNQSGSNPVGTQNPTGGASPFGVTPLQAAGFTGTVQQTGGAASPFGAAGAQNPGLSAINNLLTTPATSPAAVATASMGAGGIAGVASTYKGTSIKVYKDRTKYQEWEFIYEMTNNAAPGGQNTANPLQPGTNGLNGQTSGQPTNPLGLPQSGSSPSPFGMPSNTGQQGFPQPPQQQ